MRPNLIATGPGGGKPADRAHSRGVVGVAVLLNGGRGLVDCARSSIMSSTARVACMNVLLRLYDVIREHDLSALMKCTPLQLLSHDSWLCCCFLMRLRFFLRWGGALASPTERF